MLGFIVISSLHSIFNPLEVNWKLTRVAVEVTLSEVPLEVTETTFKVKFPKEVVG